MRKIQFYQGTLTKYPPPNYHTAMTTTVNIS